MIIAQYYVVITADRTDELCYRHDDSIKGEKYYMKERKKYERGWDNVSSLNVTTNNELDGKMQILRPCDFYFRVFSFDMEIQGNVIEM
ncbi:hypothetical protein TcasGA2_TC012836 [Tribolium castaneum]|uniref:Uncharacterized protein n=1 Tax=Tribolium castaneum TaxID=7070 RepID=D6X0Z1_TRICA|nr:hypothetical protein TcasGA2_TC012836 [Tribolium castaneum]